MANIERFPAYEFHADGFVISKVKKNAKVLKPQKMGGYFGLSILRNDGLLERGYLHRFICEAHHGACPEEMECRHMDSDKLNNAASNLKWGTRSENAADKERHGTAPIGESNPMSKLTEISVVMMRKIRSETGNSYAKIGKQFGVSTMTAFRAVTKQSWENVK